MCPDQLGPAFSRSLARRRRRGRPTRPWRRPTGSTGSTTASATRPAIRRRSPSEVLARAGDHRVFLVWQTDVQDLRGQVRGPVQRPRRGPARVDDARRPTAARRTSSPRRSPCSRPARRARDRRGPHRARPRHRTEPPTSLWAEVVGRAAGLAHRPGAGRRRLRRWPPRGQPPARRAPRAARQRSAGVGRHLVPRHRHVGLPRRARSRACASSRSSRCSGGCSPCRSPVTPASRWCSSPTCSRWWPLVLLRRLVAAREGRPRRWPTGPCGASRCSPRPSCW